MFEALLSCVCRRKLINRHNRQRERTENMKNIPLSLPLQEKYLQVTSAGTL